MIAKAATAALYELGEGPIWDDRTQVLRWTDINRGSIHAGSLDKGLLVDLQRIDIGQTVGAIGLATDGGLLLAAARGLAVVTPDGSISFGPDLLGARTGVRLNDGKVDPQGRFVVGSIALSEESGKEVLLRVSTLGEVEILRTGLRLSNGIAFSPDGKIIYHVDSLAKTLSRHSYGPGEFDVGETWSIVADGFEQIPDGMTVSADGTLWVAQWGGSCVLQLSPSGEFLASISVYAKQVSCPAFAGPDLNTLAITTAQAGLSGWEDASGAVFLASVMQTGLPEHRWGGSTETPYWHPTRGDL